MANGQRLDELRRRVDLDPASILFAQLAEEHRRAGDFEEAVRVCRAGLARHPGYLAARVTLGRALIELGQFDQARHELHSVIGAAPDNIAAKRSLAELQHRHDAGRAATVLPVDPVAAGPIPLRDPVLVELERWLDAIAADRAARRQAPRTAGVALLPPSARS